MNAGRGKRSYGDDTVSSGPRDGGFTSGLSGVVILRACACWARSRSSRSRSACLRRRSSRLRASFESGTGLKVRSVRVHEL